MSKEVKLLDRVDFGDIDGLYDPRISDYFIDYQFKEAILKRPIYFIIGRKGTGKSAIYNWIYKNGIENDSMISNLSFNNFPFEKLLELSDDSFTRPNQYQSIWRNIIYSEIAKLLVTDQSNPVDDTLKELERYVEFIFGNDLIDLHKQVTKLANKNSGGISLGLKGAEATKSWLSETERTISDGYGNLAKINTRLDLLIREYLKRHSSKQYIVQFDQLDDNYTSFINDEKYTQSIISLFKSIYDINQRFRNEDVPVKSVAYLRSDIYNSIDQFDAESARWDQFKLNLNWAIINRNDWHNPKLLQVLNRRIYLNIPEIGQHKGFQTIFNDENIQLQERGRNQEIFKFLIHRSFQRPRDLIQFCIKIQEEARRTGKLNYRTILNSEKEFSLWLLREVENEIAPLVPDVEALYELLRLMGRNRYSIHDFRKRHSGFAKVIDMDADDLLKLLYSFGIVFNINPRANGNTEIYSIIRNDRSVFNRDIKISTHQGFYTGLHTSKFSN